MIFARKINKIPEFYMIYAGKKLTKCPNFTWCLPEKYFSGILGEGNCSPAPRFLRLCLTVNLQLLQVSWSTVSLSRWYEVSTSEWGETDELVDCRPASCKSASCKLRDWTNSSFRSRLSAYTATSSSLLASSASKSLHHTYTLLLLLLLACFKPRSHLADLEADLIRPWWSGKVL